MICVSSENPWIRGQLCRTPFSILQRFSVIPFPILMFASYWKYNVFYYLQSSRINTIHLQYLQHNYINGELPVPSVLLF